MCRPVDYFLADRLAGPCIDAVGHPLHRNAAVDRAHADAEVAADAFFVDDFEVTLAVYLGRNRLV